MSKHEGKTDIQAKPWEVRPPDREPFYWETEAAALEEETYKNILSEAVDGRLLPGEGALPLSEIMTVLPKGLPVSPEIRSLALRETYPEIERRAGAIYTASRAFLDAL